MGAEHKIIAPPPLLARNKDGCGTMMLSARGVKVETINGLTVGGLAIKKSDLVRRGERLIGSRALRSQRLVG
jgi:hypothetical protein